ncbi:MAG: hypothetical protein MR051_06350 [Lentisphaeria bacterium]|nr:hypothetical protein [Lentisphaeria bacterium]
MPVFHAEDAADYNQKQRKPTKSADEFFHPAKYFPRMTPGKGYRVFAAIPLDRLSPDTEKMTTVRVAAIRQKVLSPFKYDRKEQVVDDLTPGNRIIAGEKVAPSDFKRKIYPVMNYGRSGNSTVEIISFLPVIYDAEPQLLLLMIGTNDVVYKKKVADSGTVRRALPQTL